MAKAKRKPDQVLPEGWPGSIAIPASLYEQLYKTAQWVRATPDWLELEDSTQDYIGDRYAGLLEDHLPEGMSLMDVGTGMGSGLLAIVENDASVSDTPTEYRIRLRRQ